VGVAVSPKFVLARTRLTNTDPPLPGCGCGRMGETLGWLAVCCLSRGQQSCVTFGA